MMGGNKRIIISAAVDRGRSLLWCKLTKYLSTILIPLYWWHRQCRLYYWVATSLLLVYYQPYWSFISSLRGWANTASYCSWLIPSPYFLPLFLNLTICRMLSTSTTFIHQNALHQSVQHCWVAPNGAHQLTTEQRMVNNGQMQLTDQFATKCRSNFGQHTRTQ